MKSAILLIPMALLFSGCLPTGPEPVRPLIDYDAESNPMVLYDDNSVQERLENLAGQISELALERGGWSELSTDELNPEIHDVVFISGERSPFAFGGGDQTASTDLGGEYATVAMVADNAICWVIRLSGDPAEVTLERAAKFDVECVASRYREEDITWTAAWPASPTPGETGEDAVIIGQPRFGDGP